MKYLYPGFVRLALAMIVFVSHFSSLAIGGPAVACFFALSGYWISGLWEDQAGVGMRRYARFVSARWLRLAPLLCVALVGQALLCALLEKSSVVSLSASWWLRQAGIVGSASAGLILPQQWSLDVEMQFYLLSPFLCALMNRLSGRQMWATCAVAMAVGFGLVASGTAVAAATLVPHVGFFLAGVAYRKAAPTRSAPDWIRWTCATAILCLLAWPQTRMLLNSQVVTAESPQSVQNESGCLVLLLGVLALPLALPSVRVPSGKLDRLLGDLAYPLYLFHWWFLTLMREWRAPDATATEKAIQSAMALAGSLGVSFLLLVYLDRPVQRWRRARQATVSAGELAPSLLK